MKFKHKNEKLLASLQYTTNALSPMWSLPDRPQPHRELTISSYYSWVRISLSTSLWTGLLKSKTICNSSLCHPFWCLLNEKLANFPTTKDVPIYRVNKKVFLIPELWLRKRHRRKQNRSAQRADGFPSWAHEVRLLPSLTTKMKAHCLNQEEWCQQLRAGPGRLDTAKARAKSRTKEKPEDWPPEQYCSLWVFSTRGPSASTLEQIYGSVCYRRSRQRTLTSQRPSRCAK